MLINVSDIEEASKTPKSSEEVPPQILSAARNALDFHMKQVEMEIDSDILSAYENEALSIMLSPKSQVIFIMQSLKLEIFKR